MNEQLKKIITENAKVLNLTEDQMNLVESLCLVAYHQGSFDTLQKQAAEAVKPEVVEIPKVVVPVVTSEEKSYPQGALTYTQCTGVRNYGRCTSNVNDNQSGFSKRVFGQVLCYPCQQKELAKKRTSDMTVRPFVSR